MGRIVSRLLDGGIHAYTPAAEGPLEPVAVFPVPEDARAHSVTADATRVVYATLHAIVCIDREGTELWRYDLLPAPSGSFVHDPDCAFSSDGAQVWVYRPDAVSDRHPVDRWVVLDACSGEVEAEADLHTAGHGATHFMHPDGDHVLLDVGEGQDGLAIFEGTLTKNGLEVHRHPWDDRCLAGISPDGSTFMTVEHHQADIAFHRHPGGDTILKLTTDAFVSDYAWFEWTGGFLAPETAVVVVIVDPLDGPERHHHYLLDVPSGDVLGRFDAQARDSLDVEALGDGTWLTSDGRGRPALRSGAVPNPRP